MPVVAAKPFVYRCVRCEDELGTRRCELVGRKIPSSGLGRTCPGYLGKKVSKTLSAPSSSASLGGQNAEWIVEDFESNGSLVPLSNFGTVVFTNAAAGTTSGTSVGLSGAEVRLYRWTWRNQNLLTLFTGHRPQAGKHCLH